MNKWPEIRAEYGGWLRTFALLTHIGQPADWPEVVGSNDGPAWLDAAFLSERTHEAEARARRHLSDPQIDEIFDEVAAVLDENLRRFDPILAYFDQFATDGHYDRIEWERELAHSVKRDLAWAAIEQAIGEPSFFSALLPWYERGRWPFGWIGEYPVGQVRVI